MALVSRNRNRRVRQVSQSAESCETRTLLSAAAVSQAAVELEDPVAVADEAETTDGEVTDAQRSELPECFVGCSGYPMPTLDPDAVGISVDGEIPEGDGPPTEGWDPSWAYRTLTDVAGDGTTDAFEVIDESIMEEFDPSLAFSELVSMCDAGPGDVVTDEGYAGVQFWHSLAPGADGQVFEGETPDGQLIDGETIDSDGDGLPDDFVMYTLGPVSADEKPEIVDAPEADSNGDPIENDIDPVRYLGGPEFRGADGSGHEVSDDFVVDAYDLLPIDDTGLIFVKGEIADGGEFEVKEEADFNDETVLTALGGEEFPQVVFYSFNAAAGGGALQRNLETVIVPPAATSVSFPVTSSAATPIFSSGPDFAGVGTLVSAAEVSISAVAPSVKTGLSPARRSGATSQLSSTSGSASEALNGLSPLLEGDAELPKPVNRPDVIDEAISDETAGAANGNQQRSAEVTPSEQRPSTLFRLISMMPHNRPVSIDRFMTEFAQDSFMS